MLAIVAGNRAVRGFGFDGLAIGRHQHAGHQAKRAEALRNHIGLDVAVVVLAGPHELAAPLERSGDHVVDQAVFVGDVRFGELVLEFAFEHFLEQVLEAAIVLLENGVLGRQIHRPAAVEAVVHAGTREVADAVVEIVHRHGDARALELVNVEIDVLAILAFEDEAQLAGAGDQRVLGAVLVTESVTADDDGIGPAGDEARNVVDHDRLTEDHAAENVTNRAVGADPHFLEVEFLDAGFVGGDGGAFYAHTVLLDRIGRVDRDLVIGFVALLDREVVILKVDVEIRQDQPLANPLPDDFRHFVAVEFDDRVRNLDLRHGYPVRSK